MREIEGLIPHRWPFLLVDRIVEYDADAKRIVGLKGVTATEWFFQGHFPGLPVMPGVLQVEALAQTMAVYVAKQPGFGDRIGLFAGIDEVRFKRIVVPGDTLRLEVTMEKLGSRFGKGRGVASVDGEVACEGLLSFIIPPAGVLAMTRIAVLSDVHGNLPALEAVLAEIRAERPDAVLVAGDLVLNGPDPSAVVDALRALEGDGAHRRPGNTDIAVADFDYGAAFPQLPGRRARGDPGRRRVGPRRAERRAAAWLRRLPAERRMRADDDSLVLVVPRLPGLADARLRPGAGRQRDLRAGRGHRRPRDLRAATPTSPRSATSAGRSS